MEKTLFNGVSNAIGLVLTDNSTGEPIPFVDYGVTKMELHLNNKVISSDANDLGKIEWDNAGGISISSGDGVSEISKDILHTSSLIAYDPLHPEPEDGQLLIHPKMKNSNLTIEVVDSKF